MQSQNGQPPEQSQLPASLRTNILAGGKPWQVDNYPEETADEIGTFLLGTKKFLRLTAGERPIWFSRQLLETTEAVWPIRRPDDIAIASKADARVLDMHQGGKG